eukprot:116708-Hanusia_phi.AAC.1
MPRRVSVLLLLLLLHLAGSRCLLANHTQTFVVAAVLDVCRGSCESRAWWRVPELMQAQEAFMVQVGLQLKEEEERQGCEQLQVELSLRNASLALLHLQVQQLASSTSSERRWLTFHAPPLPAGSFLLWLQVFFLHPAGPQAFSSSSPLKLVEPSSYARPSQRSEGNGTESRCGISLYRKLYQEEEEEALELRVFGLEESRTYELEVELISRGSFLLSRRETLRADEAGAGLSHFVMLPPSKRGVYLLK